ncbi:epithelial cell adhesion molecule [Rhinophrynus dorsalis]
MKISTVLRLGAALICIFLVSHVQSQGCKCRTHFQGKCDASGGTSGSECQCTLNIGADIKPVDCNNLISKCWLMKRESLGTKGGRRQKPVNALLDNDGLYEPECEENGAFKARQCNNTESCWCVNSAGVRRTDKGDKNWKCPELVRTFWIIVEMQRNNTDAVTDEDLRIGIIKTIANRYKLPEKYISQVEFEGPYIYIDLKQNSTEKSPRDVDIADVAYYLEKDIKGDSFFHPDEKFDIQVNGRSFAVKEPLIMYIDEKAHEISMKRLTAGLIAVIVVVAVAIVALIIVLVLTRRKRGKYEKAEMKEMNEVQKELTS